MLLLGHIGITLGAVGLLASAIKHVSSNTTADKREATAILSSDKTINGSISEKEASWSSLTNNSDTRSLVIGSILPDIIDKPIGLGICRDMLSNGRIFSHTLLFPAILTNIGRMIHRQYGKTWGYSLALGAFTHLILDRMWRELKTLFWPLFGQRFKRMNTTNWMLKMVCRLFTDQEVYRPEIIGGMIVLWYKGWR